MSDDLRLLADESAVDARAYLTTVTEVASGSAPDAAIPMTLLALSQVLVMGARLGAIEDIVPAERFETDTVEDELDPLRTGVANLFEGLDEYADLVDPVTSTELTTGSVSNDVTVVAERAGPRAAPLRRRPRTPRRCGGGSSATCPTGASGPRPRCGCSSRCSATSGSTPTRRPCRTPSSTPCTPDAAMRVPLG